LSEKKLTSQEIYRGKAVCLRGDVAEKGRGEKASREIVEHDQCVVAVALDVEDNVLLVRQFR